MNNDLLTNTETAYCIGAATPTVGSIERRDSTFPRAIWIGRKKFYSKSKVQAWLASTDRNTSPGWWRKGEEHGMAKWPKEFVVRARQMFLDGAGYGEIAKALGTSKSWVRDVCRGDRRAVDAAVASEVQE